MYGRKSLRPNQELEREGKPGSAAEGVEGILGE